MNLKDKVEKISSEVSNCHTTIFAELTLLLLAFLYFVWIAFFMNENETIFLFLSIINRQFWTSFFGISAFLHAAGFYLKSFKMRFLAVHCYIFLWFGWLVCWVVINPNSLLLPSAIAFTLASFILSIRLSRRRANGN